MLPDGSVTQTLNQLGRNQRRYRRQIPHLFSEETGRFRHWGQVCLVLGAKLRRRLWE